MMNCSEIAKLCGVSLKLSHDLNISELLIDSRQLSRPTETLFFAIQTDRNDGHRYILELYRLGVRAFVVSEQYIPDSPYSDAAFFPVKNVIEGLQKVAIFHRNRFDIPVIGITGSHGKTMIKEWLKQMLEAKFKLVASPKSYNSQIGVPLSVWRLNQWHQLAIFEAGISQPGEMARLNPIIAPSIGLLTNIGSAHDQYFRDDAQKIEEKLLLFKGCKILVFSSDDSFLAEHAIAFCKKHQIKPVTWGADPNATIRVITQISTEDKTKLTLSVAGKVFLFDPPFLAPILIENALHCFTIKYALGLSLEDSAQGFDELQHVPLRLEIIEGRGGSLLINDSYNLDIDSLREALQVLDNRAKHRSKTVIISDIPLSGDSREASYRNVVKMIALFGVKRVIAIGSEVIKYRALFEASTLFFNSTEQFLKTIPHLTFRQEAVLLKGRRSFGFERIAKRLEQQKHETVLEVNLSAVVNNLNYYRSKLPSGVKTMAMVKASGYGSGSVEVASTLQYHSVDYLAVAYADEGVELRDAGIELPIMVMNPEVGSFNLMLDYNLEPEIYSFELFAAMVNSTHASLDENQKIGCHLKMDTGMHRLGFLPDDIPLLAEKLKNATCVEVKSIFSHLAASDDPAQDDFTLEQIACFKKMSDQLKSTISYPVLSHISNTSAITRFPQAAFDMVRLGIGLYGVSNCPEDSDYIQVVNTLKSVISQVKTVKSGESIGYNRSYFAHQDMEIATLPLGYADGILRALSNNGSFWYAGQRVEIVGNICMDMCMINVTGMGARAGDEVEIFGPNNPIERLAEDANTITYEIFAAISHRVKRRYIEE